MAFGILKKAKQRSKNLRTHFISFPARPVDYNNNPKAGKTIGY